MSSIHNTQYGYGLEDGNTLEIFGGKNGATSALTVKNPALTMENDDETFSRYFKWEKSKYDATDNASHTPSDNNRRYLHFKVNAVSGKTKVIVYGWTGSNGSERSATIAVGNYSDQVATLYSSSSNVVSKVEYTFTSETAGNDKDVWVYVPNSYFCIAGIKVTQDKKETQIHLGGGQSNEKFTSDASTAQTTKTFNGILVVFDKPVIEDGGLVPSGTEVCEDVLGTVGADNKLDKNLFTIESSDPNVADVTDAYINPSASTGKNRISIGGIKAGMIGGTATISFKYNGKINNDQDKSDYAASNTITFTLTVNGPQSFNVVASNQTIQENQTGAFTPYISDASGQQLMIINNGDNTYEVRAIDLEDGERCDYTQFFDFTFTPVNQTESGTANNITVDESTGAITTTNAVSGDTRQFTIIATPKAALESYFTGTATTTAIVTITTRLLLTSSGMRTLQSLSPSIQTGSWVRLAPTSAAL